MAGDVSRTGSSAAERSPARPAVPEAPLALYRRYRPGTFAEVKGQDHVTEPLRQALRSGRVHHAYLFSGPRGCGKTSSARILARSLNCEQGPTPDPCGRCASCVALAPSGPGSIDVIEIDAASHGGIDDARDLRERAFYSPVASRYKIYIIDEAHMVTGGGFNALLKLVEEPPPHLKFVFATTEPEKVIATIKSRTHHYPFRLVPPAVLRELLEQILGAEGISYEPAVLPIVIRAGAGSVRDSLSVLDQLIAGADESGLRYDRAIALLGYTDDALLDEMAGAFAARDGAAVFRAIDRVVEAGHDPRRFAMDLLDRLRDLIVLAAVPDAAATGLLDVPEDRLDRMREQSAALGEERLVSAAETISAGLVEMRGATSPRLLLELMCAQVLLPAARQGSAPVPVNAAAPGTVGATVAPGAGNALPDAAGLLARIERLERRVSAGSTSSGKTPSAAKPSEVAPPASPKADPGRAPDDRHRSATRQPPPAVPIPPGRPDAAGGQEGPDVEALRDRWPDILEAVKDVRKVAWILLSNAAVESVEGNVLTLAFLREGDAKGFGMSGCDQDLAGVLNDMFGTRPVIRSIAGPRPVAGEARQGGRRTAGTGSGVGQGADASPPESGSADSGSAGSRAADSDSAGSGPDGPAAGGSSRAGTGRRDAGRGGSGHGSPGTARENVESPDPGQRPRAKRSSGATDPDPGSETDPGGPDPDRRSQIRPGEGLEPDGGQIGKRRSGSGRHPGRGGDVGRAGKRGAAVSASDDPRLHTDADSVDDVDALTGSDLVMRELGGRVIQEIGED